MARPINHSNGTSNKSNNQHSEEPAKQFQGTWACVELHDLVEEGTISPTAAWLAMTIMAYTKGKRGCFASNEYLGNKIHKKVRQTQVLLKQLEDAGILLTSYRGDMRHLRISFDDYQKPKRKDAYKAENRLKDDESRHAKKCASDMQKNAHRKIVDTNVSTSEENRRCRDSEPLETPPLKITGLFSSPSGYDDTSSPNARKLSKRLYEFLLKKGKLCRHVKSLSSWDTSFRELLSLQTYEHINKVMDGYFRHFGKEFVSRAYSASSFCEKFNRIEDNIQGVESKDKQDWNKLSLDQRC
jgi:hypothetical protein